MDYLRQFALMCLINIASWTGMAAAQDYPTRPVRFILQYSPGGGTDAVMRPLSQKLGDLLGQQIVIEHKPGANGSVANQYVAASAPDGYTILFGAAGAMTTAPHLYKTAVDPITAFIPIAFAAATPFAVVVHPSMSVASVRELADLAKAKPGTLTFGTSGIGGTPHLAGELFKSMAKIDTIHVPYKGMGPALTAVLAAEVNFGFADVGTIISHVRGGKLKLLAVTSGKRSSAFPETPTVAEAGYPGYVAGSWYGAFAPLGTPRPIVEKLNSAITRALADQALREKYLAQGMEPGGQGNSAEFAAFVKEDYERLGLIIRTAGVKAE
jgi:tripartite-type tricarboxylate transporter receptor subunit TctC